MAQAVGLIDVVVGGTSPDVEKGGKVKVGGWLQKPVVVQGKVHYSREWEASEIEFTTVLKRGDTLQTLFGPGEKVVQCNCDTGQSFVFSDAFCTNLLEFTGSEGGKVMVKFSAGEPEVLQNG